MKHIVYVMALLAALGATALRADIGSPVDRVDLRQRGETSEITVRFLWPVNLLNYSPRARARQIRINLGFLAETGSAAAGTGLAPWSWGNDLGGSEVFESLSLDGERGDALLLVDLAEEADFSVERGSDGRSLIVAVLDIARPDDAAAALLPDAAAPVPAQEVREVSALSKEPSAELAPAIQSPHRGTPRPALDDAARADLLDKANEALAAGDNDRAIALYTKLLEQSEDAHTAPALEYLGLARERKSQFAHAKAVYQEYLRRFPVGEGAARVSQRLEALLSIARVSDGPAGSVGTMQKRSPKSDWRLFGGWSQYYRYSDISIDRSGGPYFYGSEDYTAQSDLLSRLDLTARYQGSVWGVETRLGAGYLADFRDQQGFGSRRGNEVLLSDASIELTHLAGDYVAKLGRQYSSGDGVLGRFDGARVEIPIGANFRLNLIGGRPVDRIYDTTVDGSDRYFYALGVDLQPEDSNWQYGIFATEHRIDGIEDRQATGGELRYFTPAGSLFAMVDYDTGYGELNTFMLVGNLNMESGTVLGATVDYRLSPVLTTRNALIGQPVDSIDELLGFYDERTIRDMAQNRTPESSNLTLSVMQPLRKDLQLYGAVSRFEFGDTQSAGGVEGFAGTGAEYGYELQLIANNLLMRNDSHVFSLRYYDGSTVERMAFGINARYMLGTAWRLQPRVWIERRQSQRDGSEQWALRPSLRLQYLWARRYHLELEVGRDWSMRDIPLWGDEEIGSNYFMLSYRIDID